MVLPLQGDICFSSIYPRRCHWAKYVYALSGRFLEVAIFPLFTFHFSLFTLGGFYLFVFIVASLRDAGILLLIITALRLQLVQCYEKSHLFEVIYRSYLLSYFQIEKKKKKLQLHKMCTTK